MIDFLEKIKQKPQNVKKRIFFVAMSIAFFLVLSLWLMSAGNSLGSVNSKDTVGGMFSEKIEMPNISDSLKASASAIFDGKDIQIK